jgi:gas vesicle protein
MIRKMLMGAGLATVMAFAVGCEKAKETASTTTQKVSGAMDKAKETAREASDDATSMAKSMFLAPIEKMFPDVETKIKGLTGESQTKAGDILSSLKKMIEEFKTSPKDKFESLKDGIMTKVAELKKAVGM